MELVLHTYIHTLEVSHTIQTIETTRGKPERGESPILYRTYTHTDTHTPTHTHTDTHTHAPTHTHTHTHQKKKTLIHIAIA